jgi:integrase/recombinase XerD
MISTFEPTNGSAVRFGQQFQMTPITYGFSFSSLDFCPVTMPGQFMPVTSRPDRDGIKLRAAIDETIAAKKMAGLRPHSLAVMRYVLNKFVQGREDVTLESISAKDIQDWLDSLKVKPCTKQSNVTRLSSLFSHHIRRDNIVKNPCRKLERIKVEYHAPLILSPEQADTLLKNTPRKFRAYVILGMFAGIRPEETQKLTWKDICLETKTVTVNLAKTRRRRIVPLEPRAVALLEKCARKKGNIAPSHSTLRRFKRVARYALGFDRWPQDLLRHTAASYMLALIGDVGKVAARLGNSSTILLTHYHQPVKQATRA